LITAQDAFLQEGEFNAATAQISVDLVREVLAEFGNIRKIEQVITD
jgi:hypothetical protein